MWLYTHGEDGFEIGPFDAFTRAAAIKAVHLAIKEEFEPESKSYVKMLIQEFRENPTYLRKLSKEQQENIKRNYNFLRGM